MVGKENMEYVFMYTMKNIFISFAMFKRISFSVTLIHNSILGGEKR